MKGMKRITTLFSNTLHSTKPCGIPLDKGTTRCMVKRNYASPASNCTKIKLGDASGTERNINSVWLRENCQCDKCFTHSTNQRHVLFYGFDAGIKPVAQERAGSDVHIRWSDGHNSVYTTAWLEKHLQPEKSRLQKMLWNARTMSESKVKPVPYHDYMNDDSALAAMLSNLSQYGFGLVNETPADEAHTRKVSERVAFIMETFFGRMWTFTSDLARADTAFTSIALGAHTDTTYLEIPAGIQVFHCLYHDGEGGNTLLVDGFTACEALRRDNAEAFQLLTDTRIEHEYIETGVHTKSLDSLINVHPSSGELRRLRYNHYDRSPISTIEQGKVGDYYEALRQLSKHVTNPDNEFWMKLKPGTVLFVDNWRVLHGRSAFTGKRTMSGCYLPRDDWQSKARVLNCL